MSFLPYALARPFLFGLDAETAHDLTLQALARTQGTPLAWAYRNALVSDPVQLAGLMFPNRVGLAAGLDKNGQYIDATYKNNVTPGGVNLSGQPTGEPNWRWER